MVDTVRTLSALQTLLADNTSGDISPQDVRDLLVSVYPLWTSYDPTWTNLTEGNGTESFKFLQLGTGTGSLVLVQGSFVFGTTSAMGTAPIFTLPITSRSYGTAGAHPLGQASFTDSGVGFFDGVVRWNSTTTAAPQVFDADNATVDRVRSVGCTSTVPMTWTTSDELKVSFMYESA